ncbi:MAG: fumarate reductase/succinate dehydrogenase flavoprotein subunit, partial [Gemmataceae bacterium]
AAGINGANRLGGNSLSDLLVLGKLAGEHAAKYAKTNPAASTPNDQIEDAAKWALAPFDRPPAENPYQVMHDLQDMMQDLVGIVRKEDEMVRALDGLEKLKARAARCHVSGNREYNPGWHTAIDLHNLLAVSEGITRAAILRKESRGAQFRDDYPTKNTKAFGRVNTVQWKAADGSMQIKLEPIPPMPEELKEAIKAEGGGKLPEELV